MWPPYPSLFTEDPFPLPPAEIDEAQLISAMEEAHEFPGYYPVVVIAHEGEAFRALLHATLLDEQGSAPFLVQERASRKGTYISYRIEIFVESAAVALARKQVISGIEGVLYLL